MTLFERTKETAKEQGLTLRQLEEKSGLGQNSLYRWKTYAPKTAYLQKVADVLNVSVDYLLGNTDERHFANSENVNQDFFKIDLSDIPVEERQSVIEQMEAIKKILMKDM